MDAEDVVATPPDQDDFKIKGKGKQAIVTVSENTGRDAPQDTCVICLEAISERAIAAPCNHLNFDFLCLVSWLQEQAVCPLCKVATTAVQYDWRSPVDYKTYTVPQPSSNQKTSTAPSSQFTSHHRFLQQRGRGNTRPRPLRTPPTPDVALAFRKTIYATNSQSLHVGASRLSSYQNFTPQTFATTPHLQTRARTFMRRELQVFDFVQLSNTEFLIEYIVAILKKAEIKGADGVAVELVGEFLGHDSVVLFLHELEAWLRSPYERLQDWDRAVQYALPVGKRTSGRDRGPEG